MNYRLCIDIFSLIFIISSAEHGCPSGYERPSFHTICIRNYTRPDESASWFDAKNICAKDSAQLFIVQNSEEYPFSENETWSDIAIHGKSGKILWKSNSHINDINKIREESQCFMYNYTKTNLIKLSSHCREKRGFRCATSGKMDSIFQVPWCPEDWFGSDFSYMKEKCYFFHLPQTHTYDEAQEHCNFLGAHLVVAKREFLEAFVWTFKLLYEKDIFPPVKNNIAYWNTSIGLQRFNGSWNEIVFWEEDGYNDREEIFVDEGSAMGEEIDEESAVGEDDDEEKEINISKDNLAGILKFVEVNPKDKLNFTVLRRMAKRNETHGFICEKSAFKIQRSPRLSLTSRFNSKRNCIELICIGKFVHPVSMIYWYVNGERITEWNTASRFHPLQNHSYLFEFEIQETKCLHTMDRSLQGEFHCEIGGSDSILSVISNKVMVLFTESNGRIVTIDVKDNGTYISHKKMKVLLQRLRICDTSDIKIEEIRLFQSEETFNIVVHVENYGNETSWKPFESCLNQTKKEYSDMEFLFKIPSKCIAEPVKIMGRNSEWPTTTLNNIAEPDEPCISAQGNIIRRKCSGDFIRGAFWEPMKEQCDWNTSVSNENVTKLTEQLWNQTKETEHLVAAEISFIAKIFETISHMDNFTEKAVVNVASVVESLLNTEESILEIANNYSKTSSIITKSFETILMKTNSSIRIDKPSFYAESITSGTVDIIGVSCAFSDLSHFDSRQVELLTSRNSPVSVQTAVSFILPQKFQQHHDSNSRMSFIIYNDSRLFPTSSSKLLINTPIISAAIENIVYYVDKFSPVQLTFQSQESDKAFENVFCVYWDYSLNDARGDWSEKGCWLDRIREGKIICLCEHLSHFAVLMDFSGQDKTQSVDQTFHLTVISYVGCAFSILGLSLTIITFALFKLWRKKLGNKVVCNLSVSLLCVLVIFLSGFEQVNSPRICIMVAVMLHYFLLVTFAWMLVEGILNYLLFVRVFNTYIPKFMMKSMICAWGIPLIIITIVLCIDVDLYKGSPDYCWMSRKALIGSFLVPIGVIMTLNAIVFVLIIKNISCDRKKVTGKKQKNAAQIYLSIFLLVSLGLTWVFGFLAIDKSRTFFQYLFCICNSLQGFLIFAFMVVRDNNAQELWIALLLKRQSHSTKVVKRNKITDDTNTQI